MGLKFDPNEYIKDDPRKRTHDRVLALAEAEPDSFYAKGMKTPERTPAAAKDTTPKLSGAQSAGLGAASTLSKGGSVLDAASAAGMASGNPYAMGASLAMGVISTGMTNKKNKKEAEAKAEMERRQNVMAAARNFGSRLRRA